MQKQVRWKSIALIKIWSQMTDSRLSAADHTRRPERPPIKRVFFFFLSASLNSAKVLSTLHSLGAGGEEKFTVEFIMVHRSSLKFFCSVFRQIFQWKIKKKQNAEKRFRLSAVKKKKKKTVHFRNFGVYKIRSLL